MLVIQTQRCHIALTHGLRVKLHMAKSCVLKGVGVTKRSSRIDGHERTDLIIACIETSGYERKERVPVELPS